MPYVGYFLYDNTWYRITQRLFVRKYFDKQDNATVFMTYIL